MTRMPSVQRKVKEIFGREPSKGVNPDEAVAVGAAVQGGVLKGDVKDVVLLDVTPLSLGIETLGGVFTKLIEKNTTIPTKKSQVFSTASDNQTSVMIHVLQGEREMAADNKSLGKFELMGLPPAPRGIPQVEVTFDIDANGIVHVSAKDLATQKEQSIRITANSGLSDEEIKRMVRDAEEHSKEDKEKRQTIEVTNELDSLIYTTEKSLTDFGDKVNADEKGKVLSAIEDGKKALQAKNIDDMKRSVESIRQAMSKVSEEMYKRAAASGAGASSAGDTNGSEAKADAGSAKKDDGVVDADFEEVR